jgi:uncharacterized protein DUF3224
MTNRATGPFDVTMTAQPPHDTLAGVSLGRVTIEKKFHGELDAASRFDMLSVGTPVKGSAGYVALERVVGTLQGRAGSFVLQHSGTMNRGAASLALSVVPDSGTGALAGIGGTMTIEIVAGAHRYDFDYTLGD